MGSARREKNVFRVQFSDFVGECLAETEVDQVDPYLKIDFDNFKVFKSNVEQNNRNPRWSFKAKFHYEICYLEKLKHRSLRIQCFNRRSQQCLGEASMDLHSIACGPSHLQLTLRDPRAEAAGLLHFTCDMRMISSNFALVFQKLRVPSGLGSLDDLRRSREASLLIGCSLCEQQIQASCAGGPGDIATWTGPFVISFQTCLADLLQASSLVTFQLQSDELDASATLELRKALDKDQVDFKVPLVPVSCEETIGELEGTLIFQNLPVLAQMSGGRCVDGQVEGGFILRQSLPFPRSMPHPPLGLAVEDEPVRPSEEDMEDNWFVEAMERILVPFPWQRRRVTTVTATASRDRPQFYFLDPRSERTTWKDPRFLPKGWEQRIDPTNGQVYFQYHVTRQTTRMDPRGCPVAWDMRMSDNGEIYFAFRPAMRTTRRDPRGLPENVEPALDHWGRMYFKMHDTQSTTWEDPRAGQPEVTLKFWRQAQRKRWWKEQVRKEVEEMTRLKELKEMSKADMEIIMFDKEPSESV